MMDSAELDQSGCCNEEMDVEQLDSSDECDFLGEPEVLSRIGDQYQVEIPPLFGEKDYNLYKKNPVEVENNAALPLNFLVGLPIPVIWVNQEVGTIKDETTKFLSGSEKSYDSSGPIGPQNVNPATLWLEKGNPDLKTEQADNGMVIIESANPAFAEKQLQCAFPGYHLVPGADADSWNDDEKGSFLLGLYIFKKNFFQLKRFVGSKRMGDILSFYYGKFYGSLEYRRWSECRKKKSKKVVCGQKIFSGSRLQELLSRLLPNVSEECQNALGQVFKAFADTKMSLEDYVFSLKSMVGTNVLVEAVAIGKGKQDLTCMGIEPSRANQVIPSRSEIPVGKACAALEPSEIIKFLTGDYRLSKARASDLFWEAVWPRLLARGWQSEQPKYEGKDSLVFLVPGVKKFSRSRLVKGKQYFDSPTDILRKVALEPELLELDSGEGKSCQKKEEDERSPETKEHQDDLPTSKRHCYLQPRTPSQSYDGMKITVVDTSFPGDKPYRLVELSSLLLEVSNKTPAACQLESGDESASEVSSDESDTDSTMIVDQGKTDDGSVEINMRNGKLHESKDLDVMEPNREICSVGPDSISRPVSSLSDFRHPYEEKPSRKVTSSHLSRRLQTDIDNEAPVIKRQRRLTACSQLETSNSSMVTVAEPEMPSCWSGSHESDNDGVSPLASSQGKLSSATSSQIFQTEGIYCAPLGDNHVAEPFHENTQSRTLIDLNEPPIPSDFENDVFMTESAEEHVNHTDMNPEGQNAGKTSDVTTSGQVRETGQRRHSTRNRPPTAKALEALANGFLTVSTRPRKTKEISSQENSKSRTSRRTTGGGGVTDLSSSSMESKIGEGGSGVCNSDSSNIISEFPDFPEANRPPAPGPPFH